MFAKLEEKKNKDIGINSVFIYIYNRISPQEVMLLMEELKLQ